MSVERETAKTIYLELEEPVEIQKLKEVLEQAGIRTHECRSVTTCQAGRPEVQKHTPSKEITTDQQKFLYAYITEKNREFNRPRGTVGHRPAHRRR